MPFFLDNSDLREIRNTANVKLPTIIQNSTYEEIASFNDFEYMYCIAYELLIRTDEYKSLIKEYDLFIENSNQLSQNEKYSKNHELISKMNQLGLCEDSFIGFDCDGNVFDRIKQYDEIIKSDWSVRKFHKFDWNTNGFEVPLDGLIAYYYKKGMLFVEDKNTEEKKFVKTTIHPRCTFGIDNLIYIPCVDSETQTTVYKSLDDRTILLKELDKNFLLTLEERMKDSPLKKIKSNYNPQISFWHSYRVSDIKNGLLRLVAYYTDNKKIRKDKNGTKSFSKDDEDDILLSQSMWYVPNAMENEKTMILLDDTLPLKCFEDEFLSKLELSDLKYIHIETEFKFSRPKLILDEARIINLPVNLNLSKEELLLFIAQIKDEYDNNKEIVTSDFEFAMDIPIESEKRILPKHIKQVDENVTQKRLFPNERKKFKQNFAFAFLMYDLYKFLIPLIEERVTNAKLDTKKNIETIKKSSNYDRNSEKNEVISNLKDAAAKGIIRYSDIIAYSLDEDFSSEQIKYYLDTMKELIHGVNADNENNPYKKSYKSLESPILNPKYRYLLTTHANIIESNDSDLLKALRD